MNLQIVDKRHVWHPYTQMNDWLEWENRVIVKGQGFFLIDSEGRRYLDGTASMWCNVWGHGRNEVVEAMRNQLKDLQHSTLFGLASKTSAMLAERLVKLARGMDRVFYTDNGSTAVEASMKIALQYWRNKGRVEKKQFISLENGYHGDSAGAMSVGYIEKFFGAYKPLLSSNVTRLSSPKLYGSGYDDSSAFVAARLAQAETLLREQGRRSAALIMESGAQIAGGAIVYPKGYQKELARLCRRYDVLLILDEIATGFGRLGNMVEYASQESPPDIVCFGKALTGGYFPLAVTLTTDRIFKEFLGDYSENKQLYHGHTFTGHPVGCAAAIANIELFQKTNLLQKIRSNAAYTGSRLNEFWKSKIVADVRHKGMLTGIELARNGKPLRLLKNREKVNYFIMRESLKRGVHLRPLGNILLLIPPLAIDRKHIDTMIDTYLEILAKIERL
ncbi:MAG: adenosylmethionine--8-amino-7-oxononanoate transaminase [Nitrososphaera sp.]|nr:adenosylmethionine--8-amino-7-oxononanoate transaminase [Nitrososphaera sp.]